MDSQTLAASGEFGGTAPAPEASLVGETEPAIAPAPDDRIGGAPAKPQRSRTTMLAAASAGAVAVIAGGVFLVSPYNRIVPLAPGVQAAASQAAAAVGLNWPAPLAPAAKLATAPLPQQPPEPPHKPKAVAESKEAAVKEVLSFRNGEKVPAGTARPGTAIASAQPPIQEVGLPVAGPPTPSTAAASPARPEPPTAAPLAPIATGSAPSAPATPASGAAAKPSTEPALPPAVPAVATAAASAPKPVPATAPSGDVTVDAGTPDPVTVATQMRPARMTETDQVQVLNLVTELGALVRDQRSQIASLRSDQQKWSAGVDGKLADFDRRLALAEAKGAITAAMGGPQDSAPPVSGRADPAPGQPVSLTRAPTTAGSAAATAPHRYRVQAASPNLAMLTEIGRSGDDGAQIQVGLGASVPGYGSVTAITQRGTAWVVQTEHGSIQ